MYIIRSNTKVREISESAKNEGVRREKKGGTFPCPMHGEKYIIFGS
jgi:predicted RNA-binding Zn-ribbon protein involved in translation (DUF1610 family)